MEHMRQVSSAGARAETDIDENTVGVEVTDKFAGLTDVGSRFHDEAFISEYSHQESHRHLFVFYEQQTALKGCRGMHAHTVGSWQAQGLTNEGFPSFSRTCRWGLAGPGRDGDAGGADVLPRQWRPTTEPSPTSAHERVAPTPIRSRIGRHFVSRSPDLARGEVVAEG